jgi:hypothetical protein
MSELDLIPKDILAAMESLDAGDKRKGSNSENPYSKIKNIVTMIKERNLTPEAFTALRKVKQKKKSQHLRAKDNLFHIACKLGFLTLDLFRSTSSPLSSSQILDIFLEKDKTDEPFFCRNGRRTNVIREIVEYFKVDKAPIARVISEFCNNNDKEKKYPFDLTYRNSSAKYYSIEDFCSDCIFYGVPISDFLKVVCGPHLKCRFAPEKADNLKNETLFLIKVLREQKASAEQYFHFFRTITDTALKGAVFDTTDKYYNTLVNIRFYMDLLTCQPEKIYADEKVYLAATLKSLKGEDELLKELSYGINLIANRRKVKYGSEGRVRTFSKPDHSPVHGTKPRPLQKVVLV